MSVGPVLRGGRTDSPGLMSCFSADRPSRFTIALGFQMAFSSFSLLILTAALCWAEIYPQGLRRRGRSDLLLIPENNKNTSSSYFSQVFFMPGAVLNVFHV